MANKTDAQLHTDVNTNIVTNGVRAITAAKLNTILNDIIDSKTAASAVGTMASQNANAVAITGGTIDGTPIGNTTRAVGNFSMLGVSSPNFYVDDVTSRHDVGIGTNTPQNWNAVSVGDGPNFQLYGPSACRFIVVSGGVSNALAEFHFVNMGAPSGSRNWRMGNNTSGVYSLSMSSDNYSTTVNAMLASPNGVVNFPVGVVLGSLNASTVPYLDANKNVVSSNVTPTELANLSGSTSNIQTQINGKISNTSSIVNALIFG